MIKTSFTPTDNENGRLEKLAPGVYTAFCEILERLPYHVIQNIHHLFY